MERTIENRLIDRPISKCGIFETSVNGLFLTDELKGKLCYFIIDRIEVLR